ncbi:hypothetical protein [Bradyrhizobium sp. BR 10261]|uniref:hypothetical protein n=1 Tax=Bradyrhizobium sp. BR 10261 TaxID=2749992 RepID=UPI001C64763B|nr:hypothetical protein [Bradyrhizobium sp. BR 10261]MBW7964885.1 hypothetical protein [Bradyrhizobium sp. BR 10261]
MSGYPGDILPHPTETQNPPREGFTGDRDEGLHQHDIDELARMEGICQELAGQAAMPEERAGLLALAVNYRGIMLDAEARNRFADTTSGYFRPVATLP